MTAPLSLEEAQRDVRNRKRALARREKFLDGTRACSSWVHPRFMPGCGRCEFYAASSRAVDAARAALEAAQRRLEAVESQVRDPQWIGGER